MSPALGDAVAFVAVCILVGAAIAWFVQRSER